MRMLLLIGLLITAPMLAAGDIIYQWTDKEGNIHYSSQPPSDGTTAVEQNLEPLPNVGTVDPYLDPGEIKKATAERAARKDEELLQRRMGATTYEEQQTIECETAQGVIDKLSPAGLVKVANPDGSMYVMSDAEREDRIRVSHMYIDEHCQ